MAPIYRSCALVSVNIKRLNSEKMEYYICNEWLGFVCHMHAWENEQKLLSRLGWVKRQVAFPMLGMWVISASQSFPSTSPFFVLEAKSTMLFIILNHPWLSLRDSL